MMLKLCAHIRVEQNTQRRWPFLVLVVDKLQKILRFNKQVEQFIWPEPFISTVAAFVFVRNESKILSIFEYIATLNGCELFRQ